MSAPLSDAEYQEQIIEDCGDIEGTIARSLPRLWRMYSNWALYDASSGMYSVQYLKVRAHALFILMGRVRRIVAFAEPDRRQELNRLFDNLKEMRQETLQEIADSLDAINNGSGVGAEPAVDIVDVAVPLLDSPYWRPQPDDPRYSGVPMLPSLKEP